MNTASLEVCEKLLEAGYGIGKDSCTPATNPFTGNLVTVYEDSDPIIEKRKFLFFFTRKIRILRRQIGKIAFDDKTIILRAYGQDMVAKMQRIAEILSTPGQEVKIDLYVHHACYENIYRYRH